MEDPIKYESLESCWKDSLDWTFKLIDGLKKANNGRSKISDLERSKNILLEAKEELNQDTFQDGRH